MSRRSTAPDPRLARVIKAIVKAISQDDLDPYVGLEYAVTAQIELDRERALGCQST